MSRKNISHLYTEQQMLDIRTIIGNRMLSAREHKGWTQLDLASLINKNTFGRVENGKAYPSLETLLKLSKLLDVSLTHLFADIEHYLITGQIPNEQTSFDLNKDYDES